MSSKRWTRVVSEAEARVRAVEAVLGHREESGESLRRSLGVAAPGVEWPTFLRWRQRYEGRQGESWERLLDERIPPNTTVAEHVRRAACVLRRTDRSMNPETACGHLVAEFGEEGSVSDTWLRRVWAAAGLTYVRIPGGRAQVAGEEAGDKATADEVEHFHGGAGLALIAAADAEVGVSLELARSVQRAATRGGDPQTSESGDARCEDDREGRDEGGRFTATYNARHRAGVTPGQADARWSTDRAKALRRDTSKLRTRHLGEHTLARKLLAMGVTPLLTERRGFDGLDGPAGQWLGVTGSVAYKPATLDKALAELGLLDVERALWQTHAEQWSRITRAWSVPGPDWLQTIAYIDGTADPYWTHAFAASGKVSRVGRVMPCLSRIAINSGAGVPLLVETHAGAASLKKHLLPMLERLRQAAGSKAALDRLTVVDSEAGTAGMLWALHNDADVFFISVLKGQVLAGVGMLEQGPWMPFRKRDELAEATVLLSGKGAPVGGLQLRAVQMRRSGGRKPQTTVFVTNAGVDDLPTEQVVGVYLERWPRQEQTFRNGRNGAGLNRSYGYGRAQVAHVALGRKLDQANKGVTRAQAALERAHTTRDELAQALRGTPPAARKQALALADANVRQAEKKHLRQQADTARLQSMPKTIQVRDTGRDSTMTCLKLAVVSLIQLVLKEYFGDLAMEWRTFIEQFVALAVTVRTNGTRRLYQIYPNPRQPERMAQLAAAVDEINRRRICQGKLLLVFELLSRREGGP